MNKKNILAALCVGLMMSTSVQAGLWSWVDAGAQRIKDSRAGRCVSRTASDYCALGEAYINYPCMSTSPCWLGSVAGFVNRNRTLCTIGAGLCVLGAAYMMKISHDTEDKDEVQDASNFEDGDGYDLENKETDENEAFKPHTNYVTVNTVVTDNEELVSKQALDSINQHFPDEDDDIGINRGQDGVAVSQEIAELQILGTSFKDQLESLARSYHLLACSQRSKFVEIMRNGVKRDKKILRDKLNQMIHQGQQSAQ